MSEQKFSAENSLNTININWEKGRIWHSDCKSTCGGSPMIEAKANVMLDGKLYGLMKCLNCNKQGYYPNGGSGKFEAKEIVDS